MLEFDQLAAVCGQFNDGIITSAECRAHIARWMLDAPEPEFDILIGAIVGAMMDIERDR